MIDKKTYEITWIEQLSVQLGKRGDPKIIEKVIYAFTLLEQLKASGLDFIFKGGTSLLLLTPVPRRFSIDIDIIVSGRSKDITPYLDKVISMGSFKKWIDDNQRKHSIEAPVSHYKFYYDSALGSKFGEEPILLDILFTPDPYPQLAKVALQHQWLHTNDEIFQVSIPTAESILGDKLTAFAPNTTGILYGKNRPVEIIKQLYDIAFLFDQSKDFHLIQESYRKVVENEIRYRKLSITWKEVLQDAFETALIITQRDIKNERFLHLQKGISNIVNFVLERFRIEEAIICAAKTAYLSKIILAGQTSVHRYTDPTQIASLSIESPQYSKVNKLKKTIPEAFFYWSQALLFA